MIKKEKDLRMQILIDLHDYHTDFTLSSVSVKKFLKGFNFKKEWKDDENFQIITVNEENIKTEHEKVLEKMGEPMRSLFLECAPYKSSTIPSLEELQIQECLNLFRKKVNQKTEPFSVDKDL